MIKRHSIDEEVYSFVISNFDESYIDKYSSIKSISKNVEISIYKGNLSRTDKISVSISLIEEGGYRTHESYEFSIRYSKTIRDYFEDRSDHENQDYIRNKNESILDLIKKITK